MTSKKGIVVTAILLGAIAVASFSVWIIPQNTVQTIIVSDFENHLDQIQDIHHVIIQELADSFEKLQNQDITVMQYNEIAKTTSTQINSQIISLVESQASEPWHKSYIEYIEALKTYNSMIRETQVASEALKNQNEADLQIALDKIKEYKKSMESLIESSKQSRP